MRLIEVKANVWECACIILYWKLGIVLTVDCLFQVEQLRVQVANLELVVTNVASVEVLQAANFQQGPRRALSKQIPQIVVPFVHDLLGIPQHDFKYDGVAIFLNAIDDTESMFLVDSLTVIGECYHQVRLSDDW